MHFLTREQYKYDQVQMSVKYLNAQHWRQFWNETNAFLTQLRSKKAVHELNPIMVHDLVRLLIIIG